MPAIRSAQVEFDRRRPCLDFNWSIDTLSGWLGVTSARDALAAALAEMVAGHEITEAKALQIAQGYSHDNALKRYPPGK
jgi:hypothetical protein